MVSETSSQSLGWRGKEALLDLQALTAQVRKLRVRTFMVSGCEVGGEDADAGKIFGWMWTWGCD